MAHGGGGCVGRGHAADDQRPRGRLQPRGARRLGAGARARAHPQLTLRTRPAMRPAGCADDVMCDETDRPRAVYELSGELGAQCGLVGVVARVRVATLLTYFADAVVVVQVVLTTYLLTYFLLLLLLTYRVETPQGKRADSKGRLSKATSPARWALSPRPPCEPSRWPRRWPCSRWPRR